jgi:hypothetical protein
MVICDSLEAAASQCGDDTVDVRSSYLVWFDGIAGLDQLVAGRNHADGGLGADADTRHARPGGDRDLGCAESDARLQQCATLQTVRTSSVHIGTRQDFELFE